MQQQGIQVDVNMLLQLIGQLYVENYAMKLSAAQASGDNNDGRSNNSAPTAAGTNGTSTGSLITREISRSE